MKEQETIKSQLSMEQVLAHYGINGLRRSHDNLVGACPIHQGDNENAFHVSLEKNLWHCFSRNHGGDPIAFLMEMEQVDFTRALRIAESIIDSGPIQPDRGFRERSLKPRKPAINKPLGFQLTLDRSHPYLRQRGLTGETIDDFCLGYCSQGIFKGRIAIPIHNEKGELIAYAGRSVNNEEPKYLLAPGFHKSQVLFNFHRARAVDSDELIIVEGFFGCFRVHQAGYQNVVALMGASMSDVQRELILSLDRRLIFLLDGDQAGWTGTRKIVDSLFGQAELTAHYLSFGIHPDEMAAQELKRIIESSFEVVSIDRDCLCPECGETLSQKEGCIICSDCGWSICA